MEFLSAECREKLASVKPATVCYLHWNEIFTHAITFTGQAINVSTHCTLSQNF